MNYPQSFKESIISAIPNCTIMVFGMMTINLWIYGHLTLPNFLYALPRIYLTAFILDFFIIGNIVTAVVNRYGIQKFMPFIRVGLMAGILTFVAPIIETGFAPNMRNYLIAFPRNYIIAVVLQIYVALKLGMFVLEKYRLKSKK